MKFREIEPGMVISWKTEDEKDALLEELERLGYEWYGTKIKPTEACYGKYIGHAIYVHNDNGYKNITHSNNLEEVTHEFSDLIITELTAEEVIEWFRDYYISNEFTKLFGDYYSMSCLTSKFSPAEIVSKIVQWKSDHEKKEPEIETVDICRIIEILPDGRKRCVHEEDIKSELPFGGDERQKVEEMLKKYCMEHDGNFIAVHEVLSRVKAVE